MHFYSDTEDDVTIENDATHDHVLEVSEEALSKVTFSFRLVFKLILIHCSGYGKISKVSYKGKGVINYVSLGATSPSPS